jgi:plastocyanin
MTEGSIMKRVFWRMPRSLSATMAVAAMAVGAAGCGSSDNGSTASTPASTAASTSATSGGGGEVEVKMQNIAFDPKAVTVKVGQKVKWVNEDSVDHNVTAQSGADFKSDNFGKGGSFEFTADKAGTIQYVCTVHPGMDATLTVTG